MIKERERHLIEKKNIFRDRGVIGYQIYVTRVYNFWIVQIFIVNAVGLYQSLTNSRL
jgi:hypothetical protein